MVHKLSGELFSPTLVFVALAGKKKHLFCFDSSMILLFGLFGEISLICYLFFWLMAAGRSWTYL